MAAYGAGYYTASMRASACRRMGCLLMAMLVTCKGSVIDGLALAFAAALSGVMRTDGLPVQRTEGRDPVPAPQGVSGTP